MPRNSNPFECSNEELVKKMISSWIPEEDIRKHAQITEPGLNPFSLIVRCVDRVILAFFLLRNIQNSKNFYSKIQHNI